MSEHKDKSEAASGEADRRQPHRFREIARDLRDAITSGSIAVGSVLPKELELSAHYGVSRHSVRVAIAELVDEGLVTTRKRFGTVVQAARPARSYRQTVGTVEDLVQYGADHVRTVQSARTIKADQLLADELGCKLGTAWCCIASLRYDPNLGDAPLGLTSVYVAPKHAKVADLARRSPDRLISSFVCERTGQRIARIDQDVKATLIDEDLSGLLKAEIGSAALRIVRRYLDEEGAMIAGSVSIHPAERFRISSRLEQVGAKSLPRRSSSDKPGH